MGRRVFFFETSLLYLFVLLICPNIADGSFVETSSGQAARELKKRYDRFIKIDKDHRSPYAITAFVNQHGKQMYRVGCVNPPSLTPTTDLVTESRGSGTADSPPQRLMLNSVRQCNSNSLPLLPMRGKAKLVVSRMLRPCVQIAVHLARTA